MPRRLAAILAADMVGYSRLMEADEDGVLSRQKAHRTDLIDPSIARNGGRIVKTTGDGLLAEFPSSQDAVRCAIDIQSGMVEREGGRDPEERIVYRVGINLGDTIFDEDDVFGDCVNVAARLEALAEPGGVCISDIVHQASGDRIPESFRDLGSQRVKNISRPIRVWQWTPDAPPEEETPDDAATQQRVRFAEAADGVQIAWASTGSGPTLLKAPNWMNHLEYEWRSPLWHPLFTALSRDLRLVRFDQRANGLSDWDVETLTEEAMAGDIAAVADAAGLEKFALLGISQGCAYSVRYAVAHPERVSCLVLQGGYLHGRSKRSDPEQGRLYEMIHRSMIDGWGSPNPVFRHVFTSQYMPDAPPAVAESFDELQRVATSPENAMRLLEMMSRIDIGELAPQVRAPTLVLHSAGDRVAPYDEGRQLARAIPGASFVELPGNNHLPIAGSPAFDRFVEETTAFVRAHAA